MSAKKLAFLQNFYTDVTLYVPTEPLAAAPVAANGSAAITEPGLPRIEPVAAAEQASSAPQPGPAMVESVLPATEPKPMSVERALPAAEPVAEAIERPASPTGVLADRAPHSGVGALPSVAAGPAVPPVLLTQFTTVGTNAHGVVLLFRLPAAQFHKLHRNVFLNKMLQALDLGMADVVLVNVESELPVALVNLRRELAAAYVIAFGKNLLDITVRNTQIYEPVQFPTLGLAYLASATVELVEYDVSLKKRLWAGLQRMFLR